MLESNRYAGYFVDLSFIHISYYDIEYHPFSLNQILDEEVVRHIVITTNY